MTWDEINLTLLGLPSEQHDAHWKAYLDFWCGQFERKVRSRSRERMEDDKWDWLNGDLNA
mgnify:CR=1 FL=1